MTSAVRAALVFACASFKSVSTSDTCVAFGNKEIGVRTPCGSLSGDTQPFTSSISTSAQILWALHIPDGGMVFTMSNNLLVFWDITATSQFESVALGPLTTPVGAVYLDGKIYIACFGSWPTPNGDSGLAIVDVATRRLEATHSYSDPKKHVHNVYDMDWNGHKEIFVAVLGNPWLKPALAGDGLVRFDQTSNHFVSPAPGLAGSLSVRSAKQDTTSNAFYVLTQEPGGAQTKLARLEKNGDDFVVAGNIALLPSRTGGDGGADVILGAELDTVFATDRTNGGGKIYYYVWKSGEFHQKSAHDTGSNPRYTVALPGGDIVSCNQDGGTLTVFGQLFVNPTAVSPQITTIPTVATPMFFWEGASTAFSTASPRQGHPLTQMQNSTIIV